MLILSKPNLQKVSLLLYNAFEAYFDYFKSYQLTNVHMGCSYKFLMYFSNCTKVINMNKYEINKIKYQSTSRVLKDKLMIEFYIFRKM